METSQSSGSEKRDLEIDEEPHKKKQLKLENFFIGKNSNAELSKRFELEDGGLLIFYPQFISFKESFDLFHYFSAQFEYSQSEMKIWNKVSSQNLIIDFE
jgi:hypothetical protein